MAVLTFANPTMGGITAPEASDGVQVITPSDADSFERAVRVQVGSTAGNISFLPAGGSAIVTLAVAAFSVSTWRAMRVTSTASGLPAPVNAAFVQADTGGSLVASTTYFYRVSATNATGESLASTETSQITSAAAPATHSMVVNWLAVTGATGYKIYGRTTGAEQLIGTVGAVLTFTDTGGAPSGALPAATTTATALYALY